MDGLTELLVRARDGDRFALGGFVKQSQADVWRLCAHLVDAQSADDLVQETYLRAMRSLPGYRAEAPARAWLLAIARNTCADNLRRRYRVRLRDARLVRRRAECVVSDGTADVELRELLAGLDPDRRAAFVLTAVVGLSYEEAAAACGCPVGTIRSRVARARQDLIAGLGGDGAGSRHSDGSETPSDDTSPMTSLELEQA